jgi:hypothetical protein
LKAPAGCGEDEDEEAEERTCRICFCTDEAACEGGCQWVPDPEDLGDLCSACLPKVAGIAGAVGEPAVVGQEP